MASREDLRNMECFRASRTVSGNTWTVWWYVEQGIDCLRANRTELRNTARGLEEQCYGTHGLPRDQHIRVPWDTWTAQCTVIAEQFYGNRGLPNSYTVYILYSRTVFESGPTEQCYRIHGLSPDCVKKYGLQDLFLILLFCGTTCYGTWARMLRTWTEHVVAG